MPLSVHSWVRFLFCFFVRFWVVLGCQNGAFWEVKIDQHATCEFLMFIDFLLVFPLLLRLAGSYVGSISVLFSLCLLVRFWVVLGCDFGSFWEAKLGQISNM